MTSFDIIGVLDSLRASAGSQYPMLVRTLLNIAALSNEEFALVVDMVDLVCVADGKLNGLTNIRG